MSCVSFRAIGLHLWALAFFCDVNHKSQQSTEATHFQRPHDIFPLPHEWWTVTTGSPSSRAVSNLYGSYWYGFNSRKVQEWCSRSYFYSFTKAYHYYRKWQRWTHDENRENHTHILLTSIDRISVLIHDPPLSQTRTHIFKLLLGYMLA